MAPTENRSTAAITDEFRDSYNNQTPPWGFGGLGEIVYLRTYSRKVEGTDRNETWPETIQRVINGAIEIGTPYTQKEAETLFDHMFHLRASMSGRALWQMGTPLVQKFSGASLNNCYFLNIETVEDFEFLFEHLMLGGGVGFSVERSKIHEFPKVKTGVTITHERSNDADFIVADSRSGWKRLLHAVLKSYFHTGKSFSYSTILIREFGAPLNTFGGTASGPGALIEGIADIGKVMDNRSGKKLRSVDVLDIANIIGRIVVSGSSRRSAQIAIGDPDDILFMRAKNWGTGNVPGWRANSNNSIYADGYDEIMSELWKGYDGTGEPYGLLNRKLARTMGRLGEKKPDPSIEGFNPCGEVPLATGESCNLATIFLPNVKTYKQFTEISRLLYKVQKTITGLSYPYEKTNKIVAKNRRLGQSVTGILQASEEQLSWLSKGYEALRDYDVEYSGKHGIPESIRLTTVQPSGCRPADALTTTDQGILTLQEMFVDHPDGDEWAELKGVNVVRPDGTFKAAKTFDNGKAEVLRLTMSFGLTVESTLNHPWFVSKRALDVTGSTRYQDVNEWIPAKEIQEGDVLEVVPGLYTKSESAALLRCDSRAIKMRGDASDIIQPERMNPDLAWLLGYLWGDGSQSPQMWRIRFSDENFDNISKAARIIEEQFGVVPTLEKRERSDYALTAASVHLWHWLIKNGVWKYYADELDIIPEVVRRSSQEDIVAFFAGLVDADGWCGLTNGTNWTVKLTSAYNEFTNHVQHVAWAVGLPMGRSWTAGSEGHLGNRGMYYMQLSATNATAEAIDMFTKHSTKAVRMFKMHPDGKWATNNRMQVGRVKSVEHVGYKETFDIEVPDGHHYFAGAVKSHNTLALLPGQTPGIHPAFARYYIRRVRFGSADPLIEACRKRGYHVVPDVGIDGREDHTKWVVEFPAESPEGSILAKDMTAVEQLEWVKRMQTEWADNAVSVTVYYKLEELPLIKEWLKENYDSSVKSVSFLLHADHNFPLAPYEEIDKETYEKMVAKVDFSVPLGSTIEGDDMMDDPSCATGACPVR